MPRVDLLQPRRGTAAAWTSANPVLAQGEPGLETDTKRRKTGDGATAWNALGYDFDATAGNATYPLVPGHQDFPNNDLSLFGLFLPEKYGARATYNAAVDDSSAVQQAVTAAVAARGRLFLRRVYRAAGVTATAALIAAGAGSQFLHDAGTFPNETATGLTCPSATATCLSLDGPGSQLENFGVINTAGSAPTAGAGVALTNANQFLMRGVTIAGFYDNLTIDNGWFYTVDSCKFFDPIRYGALQTTSVSTYNDHGDCGWTNNVFSMVSRLTNATAAFRWEGGGGVRWASNKIVGQGQPGSAPLGTVGTFDIGIDIAPKNALATGEFEITNGGTSNCLTACIRAQAQGSGSFTRITITGHAIQGFGGANTCIGILLAGTAGNPNTFSNITIGGNTFNGLGGGGISAYCVTGLTILPNTFADVSPFWISIGGGTDTTGNNTRAVSISPQNFGQSGGNLPTNVDIIRDQRAALDTNQHLIGQVDYRYTFPVNLTVIGTWVTICSFKGVSTVGTKHAGGRITFDIAVHDSGVSLAGNKLERFYYQDGSTTATIFTGVIGTDPTPWGNATPHYEFRIDSTTIPGTALVQMRLIGTAQGHATNGTQVGGKLVVNLQGLCSSFAYGTAA